MRLRATRYSGTARRITDPLLAWFTAGEQGGIYDPSVLTSLFQDSAGTTPVIAAGQTVKRINDLSGRGNHLFNSAANWTLQQDGNGKYYLQTDGVVRLQTASPISWGSDKASLVIAHRAGTTEQSRAIVGFGAVTSSTAAFSVEHLSGGPLVYRRGSGAFGGRASSTIGTSAAVFASVLDLSETTQAGENPIFRVNAATPSITNYGAADTGSGNFGTFLLTLAGTWSGRIYFLVIAARKSTLAEIEPVEAYAAERAGYVLPFVDAQAPIFLDTVAPVQEAGYVRTSAFSRAVYTTTAEAIVAKIYSTRAGGTGAIDQAAVYVNGAFHISLDPAANGESTRTVELSAGSKTVEFVAGLQSAPAQTDVQGTWFVSATASAPMTAVSQAPTNRLVIYGDSISVGANSTVPPRDGWAMLVRAARGSASTVVEGYGWRSLFLDAANSTLRAAFVAKIVSLNPSIFWMAIGTNDYGLTKWSNTNFQAAYGATLDDMKAAMPSLQIYCQTPILRSGEPGANGNGLFLSDFRTAIANAVSTRPYATLINGTQIVTTADLEDGVHPTTAGHVIYANFVRNVLGV